jgi:hypothetical protein
MTDINLILEDFILVGRPDFQALSTHRDNSSNFISAPGWPSFLRPARGLPARSWALASTSKTALSSSVFDERRKLGLVTRRQYDRARRIKNNAAYASPDNNNPHPSNDDPVEALKKKLAQLTEREWNDFRWCGMPSRLR